MELERIFVELDRNNTQGYKLGLDLGFIVLLKKNSKTVVHLFT